VRARQDLDEEIGRTLDVFLRNDVRSCRADEDDVWLDDVMLGENDVEGAWKTCPRPWSYTKLPRPRTRRIEMSWCLVTGDGFT
jgi:hypothetical protein